MIAIHLWEIIINIAESILIVILLLKGLSLHNSKHYWIVFICFVILSSILVSLCNFANIGTTSTQFLNFFFRLIFICIVFQNTLSEKVFISCLPSFMSMFAEQVTYTIALIVSTDNLSSFDYLGNNRIFSTLIYLLSECVFVFISMFIIKDISFLPGKLYVCLVISTILALLVSTFFLNIIVEIDTPSLPLKYRIQLNSISIFTICIFLTVLYLVQIIGRTFQKNAKLTEKIHIREKIEEHNQAILQSVETLHKWKHDYTNHLIAIQGLIEKKEYQQLSHYISEQRENLPDFFTTINTGHSVIDAILTSKFTIAQMNNIIFHYSVILPTNLPLSDVEITGILGNMIDNALEACMNTESTLSPYIEITIKPIRCMLQFKVENSSNGDYKFDADGHLCSTKEDHRLHGNGLSTIADIVHNHSGFFDISAKPDTFSITIYLPLP